MNEGEEEDAEEDYGGWLVVDGAVISTVFKWECFQRGRCPSDSDSFDKCQGDSQGSQGGTHEGGGGGGVSLRGCYYKSRPRLEQYWPNTKFKTCQLINTALH